VRRLAALIAFALPACAHSAPAPGLCSAESERLVHSATARLAAEGEHPTKATYDASVADLRRAALAGNREAQYELAKTVIGFWATCCDPPADRRDEVVTAFWMLRAAAKAGHKRAVDFAQGVLDARPPAEPPFSLFPSEWLNEAWNKPDPVGSCSP